MIAGKGETLKYEDILLKVFSKFVDLMLFLPHLDGLCRLCIAFSKETAARAEEQAKDNNPSEDFRRKTCYRKNNQGMVKL